MTDTSLSLLERLRRPDDQEAWTRFVRLYVPLLLHWAGRHGLQPADAADLTQEVLVRLTGLLPSYQRGEGQTFRGWLLRVTQNQCHDFRRRRATRPLPPGDGLTDVAGSRSATDDAEELRLLARRGLEMIRDDFSETTWAAFSGVMLEGRKARDVAVSLGISENAVHLARHRVLTRLRQELDGAIE